VAAQPQILTNTEHLVYKLENHAVSKDAYLFTLDVSSLYTNIPIPQGIQVVKQFFDRYPIPDRPDKFLINLLSITLYKNDFLFNGQYYRQRKGVAMGKQYAPNFANLYMCDWEEKILRSLPGPKPTLWLRYIDDIFGLWEGPLSHLLDFLEVANSFDDNIKLTCNSSLLNIQFLDLVIFKNLNQTLSTMVFLKPTSSLRLIHPKSLHPRHTKIGVIYSQVLRFLKNCTFEADFTFHLTSLFSSLTEQGYTWSALREAKGKALQNVNYQVDSEGRILKGYFPCQSNCKFCQNHGIAKSSFSFKGGAKVIAQNLNCSTQNVIYIIDCLKCNQKYVGETSQSIKKRFSAHLSQIRLKYESPVSNHFNSVGHSIDDLKVFGLVSNSLWCDSKRKMVESKWIKKLDCLKPKGINVDLFTDKPIYITVPFIGRNSIPDSLSPFINERTRPAYTTGTPLRVTFNHKHVIARENGL